VESQNLQQVLRIVEAALPDYNFRFLMKEKVGSADLQHLLSAIESALGQAPSESMTDEQQQLCSARATLLKLIWRKAVAA
jgi:hypothetical protein